MVQLTLITYVTFSETTGANSKLGIIIIAIYHYAAALML